MKNTISIFLTLALSNVLFCAPSALAQPFGQAVAATIVGSTIIVPTQDQNTPDIDLQAQSINTSLTTGTNGTTYTSNSGTISSLDQILFQGINSQNAGGIMPVTTPLPCDSYDQMIGTIAPALAKTYLGALSVAQQQDAQMKGEDFTGIASNIQAPDELAATQGIGQAVLADVNEARLLRQAVITLITVIATDNLHRLDSNVRALMPRAGAGC